MSEAYTEQVRSRIAEMVYLRTQKARWEWSEHARRTLDVGTFDMSLNDLHTPKAEYLVSLICDILKPEQRA